MKLVSALIVATLLCAGARAQGPEEKASEPAAPPAAAEAEAPSAGAPKKEQPAAPKAETAANPEEKKEEKKEEKAEAPKKEEPPPAKTAAAKPAPSGRASLEAEWAFLQEAAQDENAKIVDSAVEELRNFVERQAESPMKPDALFLLASTRQKRGDTNGAMVDLLRLLYEYPDSKMSLQAKSAFLDLANRKLGRKLKPAVSDIVRTPEAKTVADRLAALVEKLAAFQDDSLYEPGVELARRFQVRFPDYADSDKIQWGLGQLHERASSYPAALLSYRKLLAVHPESALRPKSQFAIGNLYSENLRDYKRAIEAFLALAEKYPDSAEVPGALERAAGLYSDRLKQYELAVEINERIIKLFPKSDAALRAFQMEAKLQRDRLSQPAEAIRTCLRLAEQFKDAAAVEAVQYAATIARRDLKDYPQEAELRRRIARDFPTARDAAAELYAAAEVFEGDVKDLDKAVEIYKEVAAKYTGTKQAKWAEGRLARIEKSRPQPAAEPDKSKGG